MVHRKKALTLICIKEGNTPEIEELLNANPSVTAWKTENSDICVVVQPHQDKFAVADAVIKIAKSKQLEVQTKVETTYTE